MFRDVANRIQARELPSFCLEGARVFSHCQSNTTFKKLVCISMYICICIYIYLHTVALLKGKSDK